MSIFLKNVPTNPRLPYCCVIPKQHNVVDAVDHNSIEGGLKVIAFFYEPKWAKYWCPCIMSKNNDIRCYITVLTLHLVAILPYKKKHNYLE